MTLALAILGVCFSLVVFTRWNNAYRWRRVAVSFILLWLFTTVAFAVTTVMLWPLPVSALFATGAGYVVSSGVWLWGAYLNFRDAASEAAEKR